MGKKDLRFSPEVGEALLSISKSRSLTRDIILKASLLYQSQFEKYPYNLYEKFALPKSTVHRCLDKFNQDLPFFNQLAQLKSNKLRKAIIYSLDKRKRSPRLNLEEKRIIIDIACGIPNQYSIDKSFWNLNTLRSVIISKLKRDYISQTTLLKFLKSVSLDNLNHEVPLNPEKYYSFIE